MNDDRRQQIALFRHSILGPLLSRAFRRGELKRTLAEIATQSYTAPDGRMKRIAAKTLEEWFYRHRRKGFEGLLPIPRKDRGRMKALPEALRELVLAFQNKEEAVVREVVASPTVLTGKPTRDVNVPRKHYDPKQRRPCDAYF